MSAISAQVSEALDNPTTRALNVIDAAETKGWTVGKVTIAVRLSKPDDQPDAAGQVAQPFFAVWELAGRTPKGRPSWRFQGARAANGQALSERDIPAYLEDPSVIWPDPEADKCGHGGCNEDGPLCEKHEKTHTPPSIPGWPGQTGEK